MKDPVGKSLGQYHILEQLGEGGMALVYKAYDTNLERNVAVKIIRSDQFGSAVMERMLQRFEREAKALAKLSHPNIVKVIDYGEQEGVPYLVMEYLTGGTLKQMTRGRPLRWQDAVRLLIPVCHALQHAHDEGIIHRDIKPSNIIMSKSGEPMLTDFGISKILEGDQITVDLTATGTGIGTPEYMAPEQGLEHVVDARVDVYALGMVLYELVTGNLPFRADTPLAVLLKKNTEPLPSPKKFIPNLPNDVEWTIIKALQREPNNRFQSAGELLAALENIAEGKPVAPKKVANFPPFRRVPVRPFYIIGAMGFLGILAAFFVFNLVKTDVIETQIVQAQSPSPIATSSTPTRLATTSALPPTPVVTETKPVRRASVDGMEMVYVPAGEFIRGASSGDISTLLRMCPKCPNDSLVDAQPQRIIYLDAFWIDKTEVTNEQFAKFVADSGYRTTAETTDDHSYVHDLNTHKFVKAPDADWSHPQGKNSNILNKDKHPVTQISWLDASAYCNWAGRRLPTEAEWEKASRGEDGQMFPWGDSLPNSGLLNFDYFSNGAVETGMYLEGASPYGALEMSGNLWEWVVDYYSEDYYQNAPSKNPTGPTTGIYKVMRGGSWASELNTELMNITTFFRLTNYEYMSSDVMGFRCATSQ